jgi:hypothetical protein
VAVLRTVALLALIVTGCFSAPQPPCAFSCVGDGVCPSGYSCGGDGVCHRDGDPGTCNIPQLVDAGQPTDGDAAHDDGSGGS